MGESALYAATVLFEDRATPDWAPTSVDDDGDAHLLPAPTSAVPCALPVTLRMLTGNPRAVLRELDVSGATAQVTHALPTMAPVWIRMPTPSGTLVIPARVVGCHRAAPGAPWEVEIKFVLADVQLRAGVAGLVKALRHRHQRRFAR